MTAIDVNGYGLKARMAKGMNSWMMEEKCYSLTFLFILM